MTARHRDLVDERNVIGTPGIGAIGTDEFLNGTHVAAKVKVDPASVRENNATAVENGLA